MDRVEALGVDAMSTGVILAWATEALKRGVITEKETAGIRLDWGDYPSYIRALEYLVEQPNDFYSHLAQGVEKVSEVYGGTEFALSFGGNEMAGYHTGPGAHLGALIGARHSHLDNAGYSVDQKVLAKSTVAPEKLADMLIEEESWRQILSSLVVCFFARGIYKPELVSRALELSGYRLSPEDLSSKGREILKEKYRFKLREGFSLDERSLPPRIFETPSPNGIIDRSYMESAVARAKSILTV